MTSEDEEPIVIKRTKSRRHKTRIIEDEYVFSKRTSFHADVFSSNRPVLGSQPSDIKAFDLRLEAPVAIETFEEKHEYEKGDSPRRNLQSPPPTIANSWLRSKLEYIRRNPSLLERGVPEGREDPKVSTSTSDLPVLENNRRLVKNFLSDLPSKKFSKSIQSKQAQGPECASSSSPPLLLSLIPNRIQRLHVPISNFRHCSTQDYSITNAADSLSQEVFENSPPTQNISSCLKSSLLRLVASSDTSEYNLYKAYRVLGVDGSPILAAITTESLRLVGYDIDHGHFALRHSYHFEKLVAAVVGPFRQLVIVFDEHKERCFINTGVSESIAYELVAHLEIAIRRWCIKEKKKFLFNVAQIHELKQMALFHTLLPDNAFFENEDIVAQYTVWLQEDYVESPSPLGPEKEGYLMTKIETQSSWVPLYVCLKGGALYLFEKNSQRIPKYTISLHSSNYNECRIRNNSERPHTFEILLEEKSTFSFGAADELEMMEWIRNIYSSAAQISNIEVLEYDKESPIVNCFVTLSNNQILLHRFPNEIISRALLNNVTSFTKSSWPNSYYCLLELCCREASEMGGDWILYFVSEDSFKSFCSIFSKTNKNSSTIYQVEDERFLMHKSDRISAKIRSFWDVFSI